ncbi:MAG: PQQ-binding-like beta-propeller repeat protein [bacterium]
MNFFVARLSHVMLLSFVVCLAACSFRNDENKATDWPRFRGQDGNGVSQETGLLRSWPESGPEALWRIPLGVSYSGIAVSGEHVFTMDSDTTSEYLMCLNAANGTQIWRTPVGPLYKNSYGDGPRATPTIDGERIYALGANGNLIAAQRASGEIQWRVDLKSAFTFKQPQYWWGFSGSPFIENDLLLLQVAGDGENTIAAFNKNSGQVVWTSYEGFAAYSTPIAIDFNGKHQYVFVTAENIVSLSPEGKVNWNYNWGGWFIKIAMPVFVPPDKIFVSAPYGIGAALLQMLPEDDSIAVRELWKSNVMSNHFHTSVLLDKYLYGFDNGTFKCIEAETGKQLWAKRRLGKGSLIYADGLFIVLSDRGKLVLVEANPQEYVELASAQVLQGRSWTPPTLANGRLYLRNQKELVCLRMK